MHLQKKMFFFCQGLALSKITPISLHHDFADLFSITEAFISPFLQI